MTKGQENRFNMHYAVQKTLLVFKAVWNAIVPISDASAELDANINATEAAAEKQVIDITGFAKDKAEAEDVMIAGTIVVAGAVKAYATVKGDLILATKMDITPGELRRHRDTIVAQHCQGIHDEANAVVANLGAYGVDAAKLTALQTMIDRYVVAIAAPRVAITDRKGATAEIRELMKDTNKLLTKRLDGLMEQFRISNPDFFKAYFDARIVVDLKSAAPKTKKAKDAPAKAA